VCQSVCVVVCCVSACACRRGHRAQAHAAWEGPHPKPPQHRSTTCSQPCQGEAARPAISDRPSSWLQPTSHPNHAGLGPGTHEALTKLSPGASAGWGGGGRAAWACGMRVRHAAVPPAQHPGPHTARIPAHRWHVTAPFTSTHFQRQGQQLLFAQQSHADELHSPVSASAIDAMAILTGGFCAGEGGRGGGLGSVDLS